MLWLLACYERLRQVHCQTRGNLKFDGKVKEKSGARGLPEAGPDALGQVPAGSHVLHATLQYLDDPLHMRLHVCACLLGNISP